VLEATLCENVSMNEDCTRTQYARRLVMMNSRWARFAGVAVVAIAVGLASCAVAPSSDDQKLHVAATPADFTALGIGQKVAIWEDGRRTPKSANTFEWWYFDGLLDDGTVVVVWFGDNWFYGSHNRAVTIELTPPGKPTRRVMRTFEEAGSFSSDSADIKIGPHQFKGDLDTYFILVNPAETGGVGDANTVDVFDPKNMRLVKRIPVATDPDGIVYDPSNKLVYVASSDAMLATLMDPASQNSIGTISLGGKPEFAAFDPETKLIYQNLADTNSVVAVDLAKRLVVQRWPLEGCELPTGMAIDGADRRLFIACGKSAKLAIFALDLHRVIASVPVGLGPDSVAYDPELHRIYVTGLFGRLSVVNQATAGTYHVVDSIYLHFNAHTLTIDPVTHKLFVGYSSLVIPPRLAVFTPNL
jgi:DNA-binding beta-propeller fold protein YncE